MRLINTRTLKISEIVGRPPPYAILSHTWRDEEVTYEDFLSPVSRRKKHGFAKTQATCRRANEQGLQYCWVDTCCINKNSSSELGEAINSMFRWYREAEVCYAFLDDVHQKPSASNVLNKAREDLGVSHCRWSTRRWTLQELIAPRKVEFYDETWRQIAEKTKNAKQLRAITGIETSVLQGGPLDQVCVGKRMSWAANRETKREEDIAYSLLGIFNVNMPLVYGEGTKAFIRLQEEILRQSDDHTIFAWRASTTESHRQPVRGLFASSPNEFVNLASESLSLKKTSDEVYYAKDNLLRYWDSRAPRFPITLTNKGIQFTSRIQDLRPAWSPGEVLVLVLNCSFGGDPDLAAGVYLRRQDEGCYARIRSDELAQLEPEGRHIKILTLHGLRATDAVKDHNYDEPWTSRYRISKELMEETSPAAREGLRHRYTNAVHLSRGTIRSRTPFGECVLCGMSIPDTRGVLRLFRFAPERRHVGLVLPTYSGFQAVLIMKAERSNERILICLERRGPRQAGKKLSQAFLAEVICIDPTVLLKDPSRLSRLLEVGANEQQGYSSKVVQMSSGSLKVTVRVKIKDIEDLPMLSVEVLGPWATSATAVLRLVRAKLSLILLWLVLNVVSWCFLITETDWSPVPKAEG